MLRITVHDNLNVLTLQLEGTLAGPWVRVLEECWQSTLADRSVRSRLLDLTGVTFIDAAGQVCLARLFRQGAEFLAADCLTKDIVAEITRLPLPDGERSKAEARCEQSRSKRRRLS
jgi:hypothetical protein